MVFPFFLFEKMLPELPDFRSRPTTSDREAPLQAAVGAQELESIRVAWWRLSTCDVENPT